MAICCFPSPLKPITPTKHPSLPFSPVRTFAPATVANLGPGFDFLGCAVDGLGDFVSLSVDLSVHPGKHSISDISGPKKLSKNPLYNCWHRCIATMKMLNIRFVSLSLSLEKGLPLGSGLGSSAASAVAAAVAVNELCGRKLEVKDLVLAGLESEAKVSGYHADTIAPAIMGDFLMSLQFPVEKDVVFELVSPDFEATTKKMRVALPAEIGMPHHVCNRSQARALVASVLQGDVVGLGKALAALIPGMEGVKKAALEAGAFGCTISGAGPTAVAVVESEERGVEIGVRMVEAFWKEAI
ncbi:homoserine kinase [Salix suchowensis]|nr:homoserine kinase [Salix suchowensis]